MPISQLDQQLLDAAKKGRKEFDELYNAKKNEFTKTFAQNSINYKKLLGRDGVAEAELGGGFKIRKGQDYTKDYGKNGSTSWNTFDIIDPQGNVINNIRHTDSKSTRQQLQTTLAKAFGSEGLASDGFNNKLSYFQSIAQQQNDNTFNNTGLAGYWDEQYRDWRSKRDAQDYGTFKNAQGKTVVMHTPEDLKNALVLGFKKVKEGSTLPTPEEVSMIQAAGYKGKELQASLDAYNKANPKVQGVQQTYDPVTGKTTFADGTIQQSTAPNQNIQQPMGDAVYNVNGKLMSAAAAQQAGLDISKLTPQTTGVVDQVQAPQPISTTPNAPTQQITPTTPAPTTTTSNIPFAPNLNELQKASINDLVGKGTAFNQTDAANFAYSIGLTDPSRFVGLTGQQALALLPAIQKAPTSITEITADTPRYQLKTITSNIAQTQGTTPATSQFINATFQALHGRKANAGELSKFANQPSSKVYADILAGVPKVKTGDLNSMVDKISTSDPRLDVASGSGEVISKGGTPGDLLAQYGDKLAQLGFTELDKLLMNFQQGQLADIKGKLPGARAEEDALKGEYEKLKTTNYLESRAKELFQGGTIQDLFDFLAANRKRLENEITSRDLGLSGIGNQPIASEIILGQKRVLQEQATARIGAITASSEAAMGELDRAIQTSDRVMSAIKADRENQIDALENLLDMAREDRISLEDDEKEAIKAEIEIIKDANERLAAEKEDMRKLVVDNPLVAAAAGVSFTDTYEEALNKILTAAQDPSSEVSMLLKKTSKTGGGRTGGGSGSGSEVRNIDVYVKQIKDENGVISYVPNMELLGALPDKEFSAKLEAATLRAAELTNEELANPTISEASASDYLLPEKTETMTNKVLGAIDEAAGGWVNAAKNVWSWLND